MKLTAHFIGTAFLLMLTTAATTAMPLAETQAKGSEVDSIADLVKLTKRDINPNNCLDELYILAFTSGITNAGTDDDHAVELVADGSTRTLVLPDLPGNDYLEDKGDLWKIDIDDFLFNGCIKIGDIESIAITEHSNDGWHIDSIVTFFKDDPSTFQLASVDFDVDVWIDGNGTPSGLRFDLNLVL